MMAWWVMKIRLYRGPLNGKVMEIPDSEQSVTLPRKIKKKRPVPKPAPEYNIYPTNATSTGYTVTTGSNTVTTGTNIIIPSPVAAPVTIAATVDEPDRVLDVEYVTYLMTDKTHPDGSVFFEWDRPRKKVAPGR